MGNLYRFVEPVVLHLLKTTGRIHGYELAKALQQHALTDSFIEPGALYRTLRRLEDNGRVTSIWDVSGAGPARRLYELTADGEEHLAEWAAVLRKLGASLTRFAEDVESISLKCSSNK